MLDSAVWCVLNAEEEETEVPMEVEEPGAECVKKRKFLIAVKQQFFEKFSKETKHTHNSNSNPSSFSSNTSFGNHNPCKQPEDYSKYYSICNYWGPWSGQVCAHARVWRLKAGRVRWSQKILTYKLQDCS